MTIGHKKLKFKGREISYFGCKNCEPEQNRGAKSFRRCGGWCDPDCKAYVMWDRYKIMPYDTPETPKKRTAEPQEPPKPDFKPDTTDQRLEALEDAIQSLKERIKEVENWKGQARAIGTDILNTKHFVEYLQPLSDRITKLEKKL